MSLSCRDDLSMTIVEFNGRIGYPDVVVYELLEGPDKGKQLPVPPSFSTHPKPKTKLKYGRSIQLKDVAKLKATCAFKIVVKNQKAYEEMYAQGAFWHPDHVGKYEPMIDERSAPGS